MKFPVTGFTFFLLILWGTALSQSVDSVPVQPDEQVLVDSVFAEGIFGEIYTQHDLDTLSVQSREFDQAKIDELREDSDYNYGEEPTVGESLITRFFRWLNEMLGNVFGKMATTNWGNVLLFTLAVGAFVLVIMAVLKVDAYRVLSGANADVKHGVFHENIHEMDFDTLIKEAVAKRDYRNAVRLVFLQALKILADKQHINWQAGKTNHDYVDEVQMLDVKKGLGQLSYYFDYAWYGGFPISDVQFSRVKTIFDSWRGNIK
jgi:hypothetical protein